MTIIFHVILVLLLLADCYTEFVELRMTCWSFATEAKVASIFFILVKLTAAGALIYSA